MKELFSSIEKKDREVYMDRQQKREVVYLFGSRHIIFCQVEGLKES